MRKWMTVVGFASLLCLLPASDGSAQKTEDLMKMDLEDIMWMDVTVFSVQGLTQRQTPGVLTVIDEEEIRRSVPGSRGRAPSGPIRFRSDAERYRSGHPRIVGQRRCPAGGRNEMNEPFSCLALGPFVEHLGGWNATRVRALFYGGYAELRDQPFRRRPSTSAEASHLALHPRRKSSSGLNFGRKFGALVKALPI
jgi:hypothetical protein